MSEASRWWHKRRIAALLIPMCCCTGIALALMLTSIALLGPRQSWQRTPLMNGVIDVAIWLFILSPLVQLIAVPALLHQTVLSMRARVSIATILVGLCLLCLTGLGESLAEMDQARVIHALAGLLAMSCFILGIVFAPNAGSELAASLHVPPIESRRLARTVLVTAYVALVAGIAVPFTPEMFPQATPRACLERSAAIVNVLLALPLVLTSILCFRVARSAKRWRHLLDRCLHCGYPRPAYTRCPECGTEAPPRSV